MPWIASCMTKWREGLFPRSATLSRAWKLPTCPCRSPATSTSVQFCNATVWPRRPCVPRPRAIAWRRNVSMRSGAGIPETLAYASGWLLLLRLQHHEVRVADVPHVVPDLVLLHGRGEVFERLLRVPLGFVIERDVQVGIEA